MLKNILLVGLDYTGEPLPDTKIDTLGLCRASADDARSALTLYDYDTIIINPKSYSHFLFGTETHHTNSEDELWALKRESNNLDFDNAYDYLDRCAELGAALRGGSRVIWLLAPEKRMHFFGWRSNYVGYASQLVKDIVDSSSLHHKKSRHLFIKPESKDFKLYFEQLSQDGWRFCLESNDTRLIPIAITPENYLLGCIVPIGTSYGWLLTPPTSEKSTNLLVQCAASSHPVATAQPTEYDGLFLSHNTEDKPFARELKAKLNKHGVEVWIDEAEIQIGDSLNKKISEGIAKTKYFGIILSPRSVKAPWVERELEMALNREISSGEVVILPLLHEKCDLPIYLQGKMYADFTTITVYESSFEKLLRRLKKE